MKLDRACARGRPTPKRGHVQTVEISNATVEVDLGGVCRAIALLALRLQDMVVDQGRVLGSACIMHLG